MAIFYLQSMRRRFFATVSLLVFLLYVIVYLRAPLIYFQVKDYFELQELEDKWTGFGLEEKGNYSFTVVTGLFDIGRGWWWTQTRTYANYLGYMLLILRLDVNMIIYIEPKGKEFVERHRKGRESRTRIVVMNIEELEYYPLLPKIEEIMRSPEFKPSISRKTRAEDVIPLYNLLTNSKPYLMHKAIQDNPFKSSYFIWLDGGYGHGDATLYPPDGVWNPKQLWSYPDKLTVIAFQKLENKTKAELDLLYADQLSWIAGGLVAGNIRVHEEYYKVHKTVMKEYISNRMISEDQHFLAECYLRRRDIFRIVVGDWYDLLKPWVPQD